MSPCTRLYTEDILKKTSTEGIDAFKWAISIGERDMWTIQEFWEASQWHQLS